MGTVGVHMHEREWVYVVHTHPPLSRPSTLQYHNNAHVRTLCL